MIKYFKNIVFTLITIISMSGCVEKPIVIERVDSPVVQKWAKTVGITGVAGELKRLTSGGPEELVSDLSPDKNWLLIDAYTDPSGNGSVVQKLNIETGQKMILTPANSTNKRAIWTANGEKIIFMTYRTGAPAIVESMGSNGESGIRFITTGSMGEAVDPNLSPNDSDIAFVLSDAIAMIKTNGTQIRMYGNGLSPKFSPDGNQVLFSRRVGDFFHLFKMKPDGTQLMEISTENANDFEASWSPDGRRIAFISDRSGKRKHLFIANTSGSEVEQLTDGEFDVSSLTWGSDGYIYFSANAGGNRDIWRLKAIKK